MARSFLTVTAGAYLVLAVWCSIQIDATAAAVGFVLRPDGGRSEYLTVYGGLQTALGLLFLRPWLQPELTRLTLANCVIIHGCLVLFRAASFAVFDAIPPTTYALAATEWTLFLCGIGLWFWTRPAAK